MNWRNLFSRSLQHVGASNPQTKQVVPVNSGAYGVRDPYAEWMAYGEDWGQQSVQQQGFSLRTTWGPMSPGGVESFRAAHPFYPNLGMLAGLKGLDGTQQNAWWTFLPPIAPEQRGGSVRSVAGGRNRVSINERIQGLTRIPAVFVGSGDGRTSGG